jgi:deazaflavin-dependent oxidoreductase (nitroreductase family)
LGRQNSGVTDTDLRALKRRVVRGAQRLLVNPIGRQLPITMLETTGRRSGQPRRTAVGGRVIDGQFWMVSEHGERSDYVLNIKADPRVRLRLNGRWCPGTSHLLLNDDPIARLRVLGGLNSAMVRLMGSELLTIRVDLD